MRLEELLDKLGTRDVTIRGKKFKVRALTAAEVNGLEDQMPPVSVRKDIDPRGARYGYAVDENHPDTVRERDAASRFGGALRCAIGLDVEGPDGRWSPQWDAAKARKLADHVQERMTWAEITIVVEAQRDIVTPRDDAARIGTAEKPGN